MLRTVLTQIHLYHYFMQLILDNAGYNDNRTLYQQMQLIYDTALQHDIWI